MIAEKQKKIHDTRKNGPNNTQGHTKTCLFLITRYRKKIDDHPVVSSLFIHFSNISLYILITHFSDRLLSKPSPGTSRFLRKTFVEIRVYSAVNGQIYKHVSISFIKGIPFYLSLVCDLRRWLEVGEFVNCPEMWL